MRPVDSDKDRNAATKSAGMADSPIVMEDAGFATVSLDGR